MKHSLARYEAAQRYADSDKSDPFAYARAVAHMNNGIAGFKQDGSEAFYSAEEIVTQEVLPDGQKFSDGTHIYNGVGYIKRSRP